MALFRISIEIQNKVPEPSRWSNVAFSFLDDAITRAKNAWYLNDVILGISNADGEGELDPRKELTDSTDSAQQTFWEGRKGLGMVVQIKVLHLKDI